MANPFVAEIRMFAGNFAPVGWALCNGQLLPISQYTALFSLIGIYYGGNGTSNFALPNLQGMAPMHQGNGAGLTPRVIGDVGGESTVTLLSTQIPPHNHAYNCGAGSKGETNTLAGQVNCDEQAGTASIYATTTDGSVMSPAAVQPLSSSQPHENTQPYQCLSFIIALQGIFPARN
jgi:microcystin-dependent protein